MQKTNKSVAGYHLLMILSAVDYKFYSEEENVIRDYLAEEFPFTVNLDDEMDVISSLAPSMWKEHFEFQARCFFEDSNLEERKKFLKFAKDLVKADDQVTKRENQYMHILENVWHQ